MMSSNFQKFFDRATRIVERALGMCSTLCCESGMFYPGSEHFSSRIRTFFEPRILHENWDANLPLSCFIVKKIRDPEKIHPGSRGKKDRILDPQHCYAVNCRDFFYLLFVYQKGYRFILVLYLLIFFLILPKMFLCR
jgi:hypothetical protein